MAILSYFSADDNNVFPIRAPPTGVNNHFTLHHYN